MRGPHNIIRLIRTGATFERTGAMGIALNAFGAPRSLRAVARILGFPFRWLGYAGDPTLPPVVRALQALGPAYIKFGQILSTRPDVVGSELARDLRILQDKLPPFSMEQARAAISSELGSSVEELFSHFEPPVAAASIAQVHPAYLQETGEKVAIKILRPDVEKLFRRDIDAFYFAAWIISRFAPSGKRLRPLDVIRHFEGVVRGELDLRQEAASAGEFASNTTEDKGFTLPKVHWGLSSRRVLVMRWMDGIPLRDNAALDMAGFDRSELAARLLQLFLTHALRDGFFHADMHQGNLKVGRNGEIIALDFGIMGYIDAYTRRVYAEILYGFIQRDYARVAKVHFEAGYVPADQDIAQFSRALRAVGEPIFGMTAKHISTAKLLAHLFEVTERFGMETRTELILLQRTMVVVEGVAQSLDPKELNIWEASRPVVEEYVSKNIGPRAVLADIQEIAATLRRIGPKLPEFLETQTARSAANSSDRKTGLFQWRGLIIGIVIGAVASVFLLH